MADGGLLMPEITIEDFSTLYMNAARDAGLTGIFESPDVVERLRRIAEMLMENSRKMNLTAIRDPQGIVMKHFVDSLLPLRLLFEMGIKPARTADIGTGAGFPLLPMAAVMMSASPEAKLFGIDSTAKKISHIKESAKYAGLSNTDAICARAEELGMVINGKSSGYRASFDLVVARAVSALPVLCELTAPLVKTDGYFAALKTPDDDELSAGDRAAAALGLKKTDRIDYNLPNGDSRCLVVYKKIADTPVKYPRRYADITKHPLG